MNNIELFLASASLCATADTGSNEGNTLDSNGVSSCLGDTQLSTTLRRQPRLRLQSDESHESDSSKTASLGYSDSGHYSSANISDCQPLTTPHDVIRQKDQALFLALQDVRRLRSELERLSKSEKWYKQELRQQKHARLEALEKLYGNERTYMQENQRLQRECLRLYARCGEVESELEQQRAKQALMAHQRDAEQAERSKDSAAVNERDFENEQQRALIADQQQLIEVLRKQKRALLADLQRLNEDKDALICELQKHLAQLEAENVRMTKKCKALLEERSALKEALARLTNEIQEQRIEQERQEERLQATQVALESQQSELRRKENEIQEFKRSFKHAMQDDLEPDAIHQLSVDYHTQIVQKTNEIAMLKRAMHALQNEVETLNNLQAQNEQQQREIEQLSAALTEKDYELKELQECDAKKCAEIKALKEEIAEYQSMTRCLTEQWEQHRKGGNFAELLSSQEAVKTAEAELIAANERYASMCALCERTRFALEMREIEVGKLHFERSREMDDVIQLREKLAYYLHQTEDLSKKIVELELELNQGKRRENVTREEDIESESDEGLAMKEDTREELFLVFETSNQEEQMPIKQEITSLQGAEEEFNEENVNESWSRREDLIVPKTKQDSERNSDPQRNEDFLEFYVKLQQTNEYIKELEDENLALKGYINEKLGTAKVEMEMEMEEEESERAPEAQSKDECDFAKLAIEKDVENFTYNCTKVREFKNVGKRTDFEDGDREAIASVETKNEDLRLKYFDHNDGTTEMSVKTKDIELIDMNLKLLELNHYVNHLEDEEDETFEDCIEEKLTVAETETIAENNTEEDKKANNNTRNTLKPNIIESEHLMDLYKKLPGVQHSKDGVKGACHNSRDSVRSDDSDFKKLNEKILEMHSFIETLKEQNQDLVLQLEEYSNQAAAEHPESQRKLQKIQDLNEALDTLVEEKHELLTQIGEITQLNVQNVQAYERAASELLQTKEEIKVLQSKLLENDAALYKMEKTREQLDYELRDMQKLAEFEKLNKELLKQLDSMQQQQQRLQLELDQREQRDEENELQLKQQNLELQQKLQELEQKIEELLAEKESKKLNEHEELELNASLHLNHDGDSDSDCTAMLLSLRNKIKSLEQELQQAHQHADQQRSERVDLLQKLLQQQNQKVSQLNAAQADWEELLIALNAAQAQVTATSSALEQKQLEFEELNERFAEQNLELRILHTANIKQDCKMRQEFDVMKQTCQQQTASIEEQAKRIENLELKNVELLEKSNEENHARQVRREEKREMLSMRQQLVNIHDEREEIAERMHRMEQELLQLRKVKRQAVIVPKQIAFSSNKTESREMTEDSGEGSSQENVSDHLRILTKVLEHEYKRRMKRYDLQVTRLTGNVKHLKRVLAAEEEKVSALQVQQTSANLQLQELQLAKNQLLETRQRYEQSQNIVKCLQKQLETLQKPIQTTNRAESNELAHEVPNLIDDYKKLIQQSSAMSKRPRNSAILDLIERSNHSAPKLNKLESSIQELRQDIQQYIGVSQNARSRQSYLAETYKQPSLLDELKLAEAAAHA